jgi:hypothetical protein
MVRFRLRRRAHGATKLPAASRRAPSDRKDELGRRSPRRSRRGGRRRPRRDQDDGFPAVRFSRRQTNGTPPEAGGGKRSLPRSQPTLATGRCRRRRGHQGGPAPGLLGFGPPACRDRRPRRRSRAVALLHGHHAATGRHRRPRTRTGGPLGEPLKDHWYAPRGPPTEESSSGGFAGGSLEIKASRGAPRHARA